jgi:mono/diheme cytochrome c family protein
MKRIAVGAVILALIAVIAVAWIVSGPGPLSFAAGNTVALDRYQGANPTGVPATLAQSDVVERGAYLARAADCKACHTVRGGAPFAGGLAFRLPFGTLYSPNITPDKETGIGSWSDADFVRAVHRGVDDEGVRLYPAFPYPAFTLMTDADVLAIKAYLFSLAPVRAVVPANTLAFPFNQRWLMGVWSMFFNPDRRFEPRSAQSAEWNRGAYLAEAMAHCGDCHTPRNLLQALNNRQKFAGAVAAGWRAYNITQDKTSGIGDWSDETLASYLVEGHAVGRGTASGPMGEAVDNSLRYLAPEDIRAIVAYLRTIPGIASPGEPTPKVTPAPESPKAGAAAVDARGAAVFAGACASCHGWSGESPIAAYATLTGARAVNDPSARNVAQAVVAGVVRQTDSGLLTMPSFGRAYSDVEIAAVANYVTARFGAAPSHILPEEVAQLRGQTAQ